MAHSHPNSKAVIQLIHQLAVLGKQPLPEAWALQTQKDIANTLQQLQELNATGRLQGLVAFGVALPDAQDNDFIQIISSPSAQLAHIALAMPRECMAITDMLMEKFADELEQIQQLQAAENPTGKLDA